MSNDLEQEAGQNPQAGAQAAQQVSVQVRDEDAIALYANFSRVVFHALFSQIFSRKFINLFGNAKYIDDQSRGKL